VPAAAWRSYAWDSRAIAYHRAQIRDALGFREATLDAAETLARWLESQVSALEHRSDRLLVAACERCRSLCIEPPSPDRLDRLVRSVVRRHEEALCAAVLTRLPAETAAGLEALLKAPAANAASGEVGRAPLLALRAGSGQASLQSVGEEADKLARIRALALPADLFADLPSKVLLAYRRRVAAEELHELRRHPAAPALPGRARNQRFKESHEFACLLLGKADMSVV